MKKMFGKKVAKVLILGAAAILTILFVSCEETEYGLENAKDVIDEGWNYYRIGSFGDAEKSFRQAIDKEDPVRQIEYSLFLINNESEIKAEYEKKKLELEKLNKEKNKLYAELEKAKKDVAAAIAKDVVPKLSVTVLEAYNSMKEMNVYLSGGRAIPRSEKEEAVSDLKSKIKRGVSAPLISEIKQTLDSKKIIQDDGLLEEFKTFIIAYKEKSPALVEIEDYIRGKEVLKNVNAKLEQGADKDKLEKLFTKLGAELKLVIVGQRFEASVIIDELGRKRTGLGYVEDDLEMFRVRHSSDEDYGKYESKADEVEKTYISMYNEIDEKIQKQNEYLDKLYEFEKDIDRRRRPIFDVQDDIDELATEISETKRGLNIYASYIEDHKRIKGEKSKLEEKRDKLYELSEKLEEYNKESIELTEELDETAAKLAFIESYDRVKSDYENAKKELKKLQEEQLEADIKNYDEREEVYQKLRDENKLGEKKEELKNKRLLLERAKAKKSSLQSKQGVLKNKLIMIRGTLEDIEKQKAEKKALEEKLAKLGEQLGGETNLNEAEVKLVEIKRELNVALGKREDKLSVEEETKKEYYKTLDKLKDFNERIDSYLVNSEYRGEIDPVQLTNSTIAINKELKEITIDVEEVEKQIAGFEDEIVVLDRAVNGREAAKDKLRKTRIAIQEQKGKVHKIKSELEDIEDEKDDEKEIVQREIDLKKRVAELNDKKRDIRLTANKISPPGKYYLKAMFGLAGLNWMKKPTPDKAAAERFFKLIYDMAPKSDTAAWSLLAIARMHHLVRVGETVDRPLVYRKYQDVIDNFKGHAAAEEAFLFQQILQIKTFEDAVLKQSVKDIKAFMAQTNEGVKLRFEPGLWELLAACYQLLDMPEEEYHARDMSAKTLLIDPLNPFNDWQESNYYWRAASLAEYGVGNIGEALAYYNTLLSRNPNDRRRYTVEKSKERIEEILEIAKK